MTSVISFLAVGLALLIVVFVFVWRAGASQKKIPGLLDARDTLNALQSELLPDWFVDRLFSDADSRFVDSEGSSHISSLFDRERKTIALSWLKQTQDHVARLMDFHVRTARQRPDLKPSVEVKLTLEYLLFQLWCVLLAAMIRVLGTARARRVAGYAVGAGAQLGRVSEKVLAHLDDTISLKVEGN